MFKKFFVGIFIVLFMFCGSVSAGVDDGLVLNYPFTGNANDVSGNGNDGVVYGPILTTDRFENVDSAYEWNESYDEIETFIPEWTITGITISTWIYVDTTKTMTVISGLKRNPIVGDQTGQKFFYFGTNAADKYTFTVEQDGNAGATWIIPGLIYDRWVHILIRWDGTDNNNTRINIDGIEKSLDYVKHGLTMTGLFSIEEIHLGLRFGTDSLEGQQFEGKIDDVRIYDRMLGDEEVQQLYTGIFVPTLEERITELESTTNLLTTEVDNLKIDNGYLHSRIDGLEILIDELQFTFCNHTHIYKTGPGNEHSLIDVETSIPQ